MSLRSSQLSIQDASKKPNETNHNEELVNIIRKFVKEELEDHGKKLCVKLYSRIWKQLIKDQIKFRMKLLNSAKVLRSLRQR